MAEWERMAEALEFIASATHSLKDGLNTYATLKLGSAIELVCEELIELRKRQKDLELLTRSAVNANRRMR